MMQRAVVVAGRAARLLVVLGGLTAFGACSTLTVGVVEPALFPTATAASAPPLPGRVALVMAPELRAQTHAGPPKQVDPIKRLQLPVGAVVEAALQRQLTAAFSGGVQAAALPLPADAGVDLAVMVSAVRLDMDVHLNWVVPLPLPAFVVIPIAMSTDQVATLALDLEVSDTAGRQIVKITVGSGRVALERGMWTTETLMERNQKLLHQAAWQAATQAAKVARDALQVDRQRERAL